MKKYGNSITILVIDSESERIYMKKKMPILPAMAVSHKLPFRARKLHLISGPQGYGFLLRLEKTSSGHTCKIKEKRFKPTLFACFGLDCFYLNRSFSAWGGEWQSSREGRCAGWRDPAGGQWRVGGLAQTRWDCGKSEIKWKAGLPHHHLSVWVRILQPGGDHFSLILHRAFFCCCYF